MVYFVRDPVTGLVKIGCSRAVLSRLESLKREYGKGLFIEFLRQGGKKEEHRIHEIFSNKRKHGEWFEWDDRMEEFRQDGMVPVGRTSRAVSLSRDMLRRIEKWAEKGHRSVSNAIAFLAYRALEQIEKEEENNDNK